MTVYQLTFGSGRTVTRWLAEYRITETGTLIGTDVRGKKRVVGPATPYSLAERDELPAKVDADESVLEAHDRARSAVGHK